jgi:hypothetical protein
MRHPHRLTLATAFALSGAGFAVLGCEEGSDLDQAGDHLNEAGEEVGEAAEDTGEAIEEGVEDLDNEIDEALEDNNPDGE